MKEVGVDDRMCKIQELHCHKHNISWQIKSFETFLLPVKYCKAEHCSLH